jgi:hypothetical protein
VATKDVDWLWREVVGVDKPGAALYDAHGIVGGRGRGTDDPFCERWTSADDFLEEFGNT